MTGGRRTTHRAEGWPRREDRRQPRSSPQPRRVAGFTLIELLMVIAIGAILVRVVVVNIIAVIPARVLDAEAAKLVANFDFLRSEAQLQSKSYALELDLDKNLMRVILPPEQRVRTEQVESKELALGWEPLDERAEFLGYQTAGEPIFRGKIVRIVFDANGFTGDQAIFLRHVSEKDMIWTVRISGISGRAQILENYDGQEQPLPLITEAAFN